MESMEHGNKKSGWLLPGNQCGKTYLKQLRLNHGLSSEAVANLCGISTGHYSSLENGQKRVTKLIYPKIERFLREMGYGEEQINGVLK